MQFADGLVVALALDLPDSTLVLTREVVQRCGGWQHLYDAGLANLRALPLERHERLGAPARRQLRRAAGESVYTASHALLLPEVAAAAGSPVTAEHGWLVSMPNRHQLCWHDVRAGFVLGTLDGLTRFTGLGWSDGTGALTPDVYWWSGNEYERLTEHGPDGSLAIHVSPAFQDVLERLSAA